MSNDIQIHEKGKSDDCRVTGTRLGPKVGLDAIGLPENILTDGTSTANVFYVGFAAPGSLSSAAVWKIFVADSTNSAGVQVLHASGTADYNKVWDDRVGFTYS